jgi:hypothetical protein
MIRLLPVSNLYSSICKLIAMCNCISKAMYKHDNANGINRYLLTKFQTRQHSAQWHDYQHPHARKSCFGHGLWEPCRRRKCCFRCMRVDYRRQSGFVLVFVFVLFCFVLFFLLRGRKGVSSRTVKSAGLWI